MTGGVKGNYSYDAAGNLMNDGYHTYTYDAESRITQVDGGVTASYVYDPNGRRVRKTTASNGAVDFLYDLSGHEITELSSTGAWNRGEIYAGGRHVATYKGGTTGTTYFHHADWLGTERARTAATGTVYETCTSLPFGDWLTCSNSDASPMHFTGQERDAESGLDNFGARYDSSSMGRFMSPDPAGSAVAQTSFPQSWNLYSYVMNNPLNFIDPTGLDCAYLNDEGGAAVYIDHDTNIGECEQNGGYWANGWIANFSWVQPNPDNDQVVILSQFADGSIGKSLATPTWTMGAFFPFGTGGADIMIGGVGYPPNNGGGPGGPPFKPTVAYTASGVLSVYLGMGFAGTATYVPSQHLLCAGGGGGVDGGHNVSVGPVVVDANHTRDILGGPSLSGGYNLTLSQGAQGSINFSGSTGGYSYGVPGGSAMVTYSGCATIF